MNMILNSVLSMSAVLTEGAEEGLDIAQILIVSIVIGAIVGLIYAVVLKGQLTSVYKNDSASDYTRKDSFNCTEKKDIFLGSKTEVTRKNNSSGAQGNPPPKK